MQHAIPKTEIESYALNKDQEAFRKQILHPILFPLFMLFKLPMGIIAGLRVRHLTSEECRVTVPYKYLNKNPFKSTYFAVLAMAAEMSMGAIVVMSVYKSSPSVATLVTGLEGEFTKKAADVSTFTCTEGQRFLDAAERARKTGEAVAITAETIGRSASGEEVARFKIEWSFKARKS